MPSCPKCGHEPRHRLLSSPCPACRHIWWDTEDYVRWLAAGLDVRSVLDIGCGLKGVIAQAYWEEIGIAKGYACDRHVVKDMPEPWEPQLCDIERLSVSVDFVTHCGLLEHLDYAKAFRVLEHVEQLARKRVFFTCSALLREVDYKVRADGNPYHYYRSWWDARTFELLGYTVDRERMRVGETFCEEVICWFDPKALPPWSERVAAARAHVRARSCAALCGAFSCSASPIFWDVSGGDACYCLEHAEGHVPAGERHSLASWRRRGDVEEHAQVGRLLL